MNQQIFKDFNEKEQQTWRSLFKALSDQREHQAVRQFAQGIEILGINGNHTPDLDVVNEKLYKATGWRGVPVKGLESGDSFYPALARKEFPIGNFIRNDEDLSYTPEPDIFHDFYGHIPFFVDKDYADFNQKFGERTSKYLNDPKKLEMYERFYWFTLEFGLLKTNEGVRIFGAGLMSSSGESTYALSEEPEVIPFDIQKIALQEYRIDIYQKKLFLLDSVEQLYTCLDEFEDLVNSL